jgi:hypothetical protein
MSGSRPRARPKLVWDNPARDLVDRLTQLGCEFGINLAEGAIIIAYPASASPVAREQLGAEVAENLDGLVEFFLARADRSRRGAP